MNPDMTGIINNYRERMQRLAIFEPLFRLQNKRGLDRSKQPIDYYGLGFLTLLFFYENMLMRNRKTGVNELAQFFAETNRGRLDLTLEDYSKIAREIVDVFRPPTGRRNSKTYFNWGTGQEETYEYSILQADRWDTSTNVQYYTLADQGLELVFATREYFSEFQISINQLLLRKQLEKGEFVGALRQIDEMRVAVQALHERMIRIKHEVQRNVVSDQTYERYRDIIEDINLRLGRENEEFEELHAFVRDTRSRMEYEARDPKSQKTYALILQIDYELGEVHHQHAELFRESIRLKTTTLQAAQESLYYTAMTSFNFQNDITDRLISTPLPLHAARQLVNPMLNLEFWQGWSPIAVFLGQRIDSSDKSREPEYFPDSDEEQQLISDKARLRMDFRSIMEIILELMEQDRNNCITLREVVEYFRYKQLDWLDKPSFYHFWILLHQRSPLKMTEPDEETRSGLFGEVLELIQDKAIGLMVSELGGIVQATKRYSIQDMELRLEGAIDDAAAL